jgi:hypothetical protein
MQTFGLHVDALFLARASERTPEHPRDDHRQALQDPQEQIPTNLIAEDECSQTDGAQSHDRCDAGYDPASLGS